MNYFTVENGFVCPPRETWPEATGDWKKLFSDHAVCLLILSEVIYPAHGKSAEDTNKSVPVLTVGCSDAFSYACADCEDLPLLGFGKDTEEPFWDLYEKYRTKGYDGVTEWCALRRQMQPLKPIVEKMKKRGTWTDELEALPE